ncbi:MAG: mechanosensitive ion channel family protein [Nitrospira sp.]|nr:mechanosensitive ion channel family protein [Nitrospira sp.]MDH5498266.1 mechanosensitive ion channel family protein [Nitrospira sp.]
MSTHDSHTTRTHGLLLAICCAVMTGLTAVPAFADPSGSGSGVPVRFHGETLFTLQTGLANVDAASRAAAIEKRLDRLTHATPSVIDSLRVEDHEQTAYVLTSEEVLFVVTDNEAKAAGKPRHLLAEEQTETIREAILALPSLQSSREPASPMTLRNLLWAGVATALLIFFAVAFHVLFPRLYEALEAWSETQVRAVSLHGLELIAAEHLSNVLVFCSKTLRGVLSGLGLYWYFHFVLNLFPQTRVFEQRFLEALAVPFEQIQALLGNWGELAIGLLLALVATGLFLAFLKAFREVFPSMLDKVSAWGFTTTYSFKIQRVEMLSGAQISDSLLVLLRALRLAAYVSLTYLYVTSILGFFPSTRKLSVELLNYMIEPIKMIAQEFVTSLPDVIAIAIIIVVTNYIIKLIHMFFNGIKRGAITFQGFHREWATPTYKIVRFFVLVLAAVAIFPYIPGSHSEAFRGISVFLGVLVSLGAAGSFSNIVAGVVLTYMRPFSVGDRVKIADTVGDITEKTLLVTRIRTIKNVDVTIPNALVLGSHIINFSSSSMKPPPLILHTSLTIGYDAPWQKVHELLIAAAKQTAHILETPEPFVLQTSLDDFYVRYEVNAYTGAPNKMATIYSELHQHIRDQFNEAGVEIMSPHYTQIRDGNRTTIPDEYLPKTYHAPSWRSWPLGTTQQHQESPPSGGDGRAS